MHLQIKGFNCIYQRILQIGYVNRKVTGLKKVPSYHKVSIVRVD